MGFYSILCLSVLAVAGIRQVCGSDVKTIMGLGARQNGSMTAQESRRGEEMTCPVGFQLYRNKYCFLLNRTYVHSILDATQVCEELVCPLTFPF